MRLPPQAEEAAKQSQPRTEVTVSNGVLEQIAKAEAARKREGNPTSSSSVDAETNVSDAMVSQPRALPMRRVSTSHVQPGRWYDGSAARPACQRQLSTVLWAARWPISLRGKGIGGCRKGTACPAAGTDMHFVQQLGGANSHSLH